MHDGKAGQATQRGNNPGERHPEWARSVRFDDAQDEDAGAHQRKRKQRSDIGEIAGLRRVTDERRRRDNDPVDRFSECIDPSAGDLVMLRLAARRRVRARGPVLRGTRGDDPAGRKRLGVRPERNAASGAGPRVI
jgi:hypothetical protein